MKKPVALYIQFCDEWTKRNGPRNLEKHLVPLTYITSKVCVYIHIHTYKHTVRGACNITEMALSDCLFFSFKGPRSFILNKYFDILHKCVKVSEYTLHSPVHTVDIYKRYRCTF